MKSKIAALLLEGGCSMSKWGARAPHDWIVEEGGDEVSRHVFDPRNLQAQVGAPSMMLDCSTSADWQTALLRTYRCRGGSDPFEIAPSDDQKIVVNLSGHEELRSLRGGLWRSGIKRVGSVGMTPPGEGARLQWHSLNVGGFTTAHLYLPRSILDETWDEFRPSDSSDRGCLNSLALDHAVVAAIVRELVQGSRAGASNLFAEERLYVLARYLVTITCRREDDAVGAAGPLNDKRLRRALDFMSFDLSVHHGLHAIAKEAGISIYHFARLFRLATGRTPFAYLTDLRLQVARSMLERSDVAVADIGRRVGYPIPRNFSATFFRHFGMSPATWRRSKQGRSGNVS